MITMVTPPPPGKKKGGGGAGRESTRDKFDRTHETFWWERLKGHYVKDHLYSGGELLSVLRHQAEDKVKTISHMVGVGAYIHWFLQSFSAPINTCTLWLPYSKAFIFFTFNDTSTHKQTHTHMRDRLERADSNGQHWVTGANCTLKSNELYCYKVLPEQQKRVQQPCSQNRSTAQPQQRNKQPENRI